MIGTNCFWKIIPGIILFLCVACETDPVIYVDHPPIPVIYGIFNKTDSVHYLKVGRSFGAENDPLASAQVPDSLYFSDLEDRITITVDGGPVKVEIVKDIPKDSGIFHFPGQSLYRFETGFKRSWRNIHLELDVPGLQTVKGRVSAVSIGKMVSPKEAQQYIFLVPGTPFKVIWNGNPWNEIDVGFEFIEEFEDSTFHSKWVYIQNTGYFDSPHDKFREMTITYDEFIREVLLQLPPNDSVRQVFFGNISISIHGGDNNMVQYIKYLNGYNDFNVDGFSNIENGIGLLAGRSTKVWDSLSFDYHTRQALINENRLKVLKISPWN